jgi:hypothetical protein
VKWTRVSKYAEKSDCGDWSICAYGSEVAGRFTFGAWRTITHPLGRLMLACNLPDASTARFICEDDDFRIREGRHLDGAPLATADDARIQLRECAPPGSVAGGA